MITFELWTNEGQHLGDYDSREEAEQERDQLIKDGFVGGYNIKSRLDSFGEVVEDVPSYLFGY